jgi:hypothetical protein
MEKENHEKVFSTINSVIRYLATFWAMLFYPKRTLADFNSPNLISPGYFILINILLSVSLAQFIGYDVAAFAISNPVIERLTGSSFISIRFFLGISIFLVLLRLFLKWGNLKTFIKLLLPIFCYCSVLYLPKILIEHYYSEYVMGDLLDIFSKIISGIPITIGISTYFEFILYVLIRLTFLAWWLRLLYLGIAFLKMDSPIKIKKALVFSCLIFLAFQAIIFSALFIKINGSTIQCFLTIGNQKVEKELSLNPPNYIKAAILSDMVAENQYMPEYVRYVYKLKKIISTVGMFKVNENLISKGLGDLRNEDYDHVHDILNEELKVSSVNSYYMQAIRKDLEDAVKFRNSPSFIDLRKEHMPVEFGLSTVHQNFEPRLYMKFEADGSKSLFISAAIPPSFMSLFP